MKSAIFFLLEKLEKGNSWLIIIAILMAPLSWSIESLKWKLLTNKFATISFPKALGSVLTGMSFAFVTPGKVGDFLGRMLYFDSGVRIRTIIAVLIGNFAHVIVTFVMGILGLVVLNIINPGWWQLLLLMIAVIIGIAFIFLYSRINSYDFPVKNHLSKFNRFLIALKILKRYSNSDLWKVCLFSLAKFCTYTIQFLIIASIFGISMNWIIGFFIAAAMFWLIMVIPSFIVADIIVRGYVAELLFISTGLVSSSVSILGGSYTLWLINWVIPAIIGSIVLLLFRFMNRHKKNTESLTA